MKNNTSNRKTSKTYIAKLAGGLTAILLIALIINGCGQDNLTGTSNPENINPTASHTRHSKAKTSYAKHLALSTYKDSKISQKQYKIVNQAIGRLDIFKKNGFYRIKQSSGAQVNISEQLYKHIKKGFEHTNKLLHPEGSNYSPPRIKTMSEGGQPGSSTDCLPQSISHAGSASYQEVKSYCNTHYPGGVPPGDVLSVIQHFYPGAYTSGAPSASNNFNTIEMFQTSNSTMHAVNGVSYNSANNTIRYHDYQNNNHPTYGYMSPGDIYKQYVIP